MARPSAMPVSGSQLDNRRVLAALIDLLIVGAGYAVILAAAGKLGAPAAGGALTAVGIGWALYYYFAMESGDGQTLGKRVMKIRVVDVNGAPAGMREVALRTALRVIDGLFLYLVGLIVMLATRERRGRLGDLVGGTMIVSAEKAAPAPDPSAPEAPAAAGPRVPIAESGPAFAPAEAEPVAEAEPAVEAEPEVASVEEAEPVEDAGPEVASPALVELASDVTAVTEDPEREVEEEPEPEIEELPAAETEQAEAEEAEAPAAAVEDEEDHEVTVKSVETVSAIDLVMEDEEAVAGPRKRRPA